MYNLIRVRQSEILQLLLLDTLYAQSGSENIIFQGGTALRWVYGGDAIQRILILWFIRPFQKFRAF